MKIGILDQAPIVKGSNAPQALRNAEEIAVLADELGYHRMWMAEHHNTRNFASTAPEIVAARLAALTKRIRIGTGGVMMMHYSPLKLAEVFKTLSAFSPGRIDFGAGRAPGGDHFSTRALAEGRAHLPDDLYDKLHTTMQLIADRAPKDPLYEGLLASPYDVPLPEAWLLGSTGNSAIRAGRLGVGYSFAQFFNGQMTREIFDAYRDNFEPSYFMPKPIILVTYSATVAETREEAEYIAKPADLMRLSLMRGSLQPVMTPEEARDYPLTEADLAIIRENRKLHLVGTPAEVADQLRRDQELYGFDEVMINSTPHGMASRLSVFRLLARELLR
ncbi:LLM class flavin-dependent oxidoreductase [Cohnella sp. GCM10012308]|uniref:LLM class flavin-dependent oxidoreductase n=1 Tax=Cohnella sp. GCM10012308 TaxID=3317329 RepID=UPI00361F3DEA